MNLPFLNKAEHKKYIKKLKSHVFRSNPFKNIVSFDMKQIDDDKSGFPLPYGHPLMLYVMEQLDYYGLFRFTHKIPLFLIKICEILWFSIEAATYPFLSNNIETNIKRIMGSRIRKKYGEERVPEIVKRLRIASMRYLARYLLEAIFVFPAMLRVKGFAKKYVSLKVLDEKLYKFVLRRGGIIISAHVANFLVYTFFGMTGHHAVNVMDLESMAGFVPFIRAGNTVLIPNPKGDKSARDKKIREMLDAEMKKKCILCLFADAGYPYFPLVPFFGDYCRTAAGSAALALFYNRRMALMWVETDPKRKHHTIVIGSEIKYNKDFTIPRKKLIMQNTLELNRILETHIRKHLPEWTFLPVYHQNKIFHHTARYNGDDPCKSLIERLEFYEKFIKMSYEEDRDDHAYREILKNAIEKLKES
ncbi:MAG: hypothetical protein ACTSSI_10500 [Candidatus Helarchaeota archaeon]